MKSSEFDYDLPESLIASFPLEKRDHSRLLVLERETGNLSDKVFTDMVDYINQGDLLIFNDSRVMAARLFGQKESGGKIELLIERVISSTEIKAHMRASRSPKIGTSIEVSGHRFEILDKQGSLYSFKLQTGNIWEIMDAHGHIPLPPYMKREDELSDRDRYQTVYSRMLGSVAAPTAGLHFTEELMKKAENKGVEIDYVTLHVGSGTFQPVQVEDVNSHQMHSEYIEVSAELCEKIKQTKAKGKKVIAVGTTTVRSLETAALSGLIEPFTGESDIFLYPGKSFNVVDAMITNFHLPRSTLIMLVSAFASKSQILNTYKHAVANQYRFFSYGDAMMIL